MDTTDRDSEGTALRALAPRPLADFLADQESAFVKGPACTVALILDSLSDDDGTVLRTWMADPLKKHSWIAKGLKKSGHPIQQSTVGRHRKGDCSCPK